MMRKIFTAVLILASMQGGFAQAIQMASPKFNKMVKTCTVQQGELADATCQAFVIGVADTTAFYASAQQLNPQFCIPKEITSGQLVAVYRDYLKENHSLRQFSAAALAILAFKKTFPCQ
jgi:hypothetical protein